MKIRTERIECYWAKGKDNTRDYRFYVDFPRNATKAEESARKAFIKLIKGYESTEGRGYNWRVSVQALRAVIDLLPDPTAIKAEMERFDAEGVKPPTEPYHVCRLDVGDIDVPTVIHLTFDEVPECFRRACDYWRTTHRLTKDEYYRVSLFSGRQMSITQGMLLAFESWLVFDTPWQELYDIAFAERKRWDEEYRARMYERDAPFRAKHPDWDTWTTLRQERERYKAWKESYEWQERINSFRREYQQKYSFNFTSTSQITQALELFGLSSNATLQDVKKRYRVLAKQHHPDIGGSEDAFKKLNNANEVLMRYYS